MPWGQDRIPPGSLAADSRGGRRALVPEQRTVGERLGIGDGGLQIETPIGVDGELRVTADLGESRLDAPPVFRQIGAADFHFYDAVAAVDVAAHLRA